MSELELHLSAPVARTLESWDWQAPDPRLRDAVPTVARGHNVVLVLPPSPAAAAPAHRDRRSDASATGCGA